MTSLALSLIVYGEFRNQTKNEKHQVSIYLFI